MIKNKNDYIEYVKADRMALNNPNWKSIVWRYLKTMRKAEFYTNCRGGWIAKLYRFKLKLRSEKSGICIPINTFGKGLGLFHYGTIIVNATAKFGDYCVIQTCTVISKNVSGRDDTGSRRLPAQETWRVFPEWTSRPQHHGCCTV